MSTSTFDTAALWSATALATDQNAIVAAGLSVRQRKLLTLLSQPMSVSQLASSIALPVEEVRVALDRFAKLGLAQSGEPVPLDPMQLRSASSVNAVAIESPSRMPMMIGIAIALLALVAAAAWMLRGGSTSGVPTQTQVASNAGATAVAASAPTVAAETAATAPPKSAAVTPAPAAPPVAPAAPTQAAAAPLSAAATRAAAAAALAAAAPAKTASPTPAPTATPVATKSAAQPATSIAPVAAAVVPAPTPAPALTPVATPAPVATAPAPAAPATAAPTAAPAAAPAVVAPARAAAATPARATPAPAREIKLVNRVEPKFPRDSDADKGTVRARLQVDAKGTVTGVEILEANPPRVFDRTVRSALQQWRYEPTGEAFSTLAEISFSR